ncbi:MAG: hypothetical protein MI754_04365 [Chromatiales bacterium]|nr:hypothetical protein [Chromatiales bacterium]
MKQYAFALVFGITAPMISSSTLASNTILCPDISQARQIVDCPAEEEVKRMFKSTCGFERDPKAAKPEKCDSYAEFKRRKYNALWESSDGEFMGYVTCALPPAEVKMIKPSSVAVSQKNGLYKIACNYAEGIKFTLRTRSVCKVPGVKNSMVVMRADCGSDGSACKVECD